MEQNTALLVMDMQSSILSNFTGAPGLVAKTAEAIEHARRIRIPVIYVCVGFRAGAPEISSSNKGFAARRDVFNSFDPVEWLAIHPALQPGERDITVTKRRVSAFSGSDLEIILRAQQISQIVLAGYATSGVVLSTVREAADKDFGITVLSDACGDQDPEVHQVLVNKVFPRQADVVSVLQWSER